MITISNLAMQFGGSVLFKQVDLQFTPGNCYGIIGANGAGKSTFLKILSGELEPTSGEVSILPKTRMSVLKQDQNAYNAYNVMDTVIMGNQRLYDIGKEKEALYAKEEMTEADGIRACELEEEYAELGGWEAESDASRILQGLGVGTEFHSNDMATLDARLKVKVLLAQALFGKPDIILLDEPTNHLDIYTRENLTEALMAYTGTLLMVTHDRHLMNSLGCPILYLEDGKATLYPSYDALMGRAASAAAPEKAGDQPAKAGYGKEQRRRRAELRAKIKACEDEMEACGAREVELDNEINSPEVYNDPDLLRQKSDELSDLRFHQEELFAAWEKAMEEQEQYEQAAGEE